MNTQIARGILLFTLFFVPLLADAAGEAHQMAEEGLQQLKAWNAIEQHDGTGIDREPYSSDGKIGKLELAHAGVQDLNDSRFLRHGLGDGEGFLDRQELARALRDGLITIGKEGNIGLTEKGLRQSKAWNARPGASR
jgi:hypothetical protein